MLSFIIKRYSCTPHICMPLLHLGCRSKQAYVLLIFVEWALKQLEVNGVVRLITGTRYQ